MSLSVFDSSFKPETRSSGQVYVRKGAVTSSQPSDTEVQAYIRGASTYRINLKSESVSSPLINAACTCQKGLCKHIYAALLKVEQSHQDFLDGKNEIEYLAVSSPPKDGHSARSFQKPAQPPKATVRPPTQAQLDSQAAQKVKQALYRKEQYQKQKQRLKEKKLTAKKRKPADEGPQFPTDVQQAINFFTVNGFLLESPLNAIVIGMAKKRLSRVFHPDIGGSHAEILELNKNYEILINFIKATET